MADLRISLIVFPDKLVAQNISGYQIDLIVKHQRYIDIEPIIGYSIQILHIYIFIFFILDDLTLPCPNQIDQ